MTSSLETKASETAATLWKLTKHLKAVEVVKAVAVKVKVKVEAEAGTNDSPYHFLRPSPTIWSARKSEAISGIFACAAATHIACAHAGNLLLDLILGVAR